MKNRWLILIGIVLSLFIIEGQRSWVFAVLCTNTNQCESVCSPDYNSWTCQFPLDCDEHGLNCVPSSPGTCYCTDPDSDLCVDSDGNNRWGSWGACTFDEMADRCLRTRFCLIDINIYQIDRCECNGNGGGNGASPSPTPSPTPEPADISGQVFLMDTGAEAGMVGGYCGLQSGTAEAGRPGGGSQVTASEGGTGGGVQADGDYTIVDVPGGSSNSVTLSIGDPSIWSCDCPGSCVYGGKTPPVSGLDYYVTDEWPGWFQGVGGNFHADGGDLTVNIPSSCSGVCEPYLIVEDSSSGATGLTSYTGSCTITGEDCGEGNLSEDGNDWQAQTSYQGLETGYNYFARILEDDPNGIGEWVGGKPADGTIGVFKGDGVSRISGDDWNILDGTVVVLLVPNNIVIDVNIDVAVGGFLAIISSGDITIGNEVTNVEGVYIADGVIKTCELSECGNISGGETVADRQLRLEGIFTGWGGVGLRRDFGTTDNNTNPAELFVYRPDLQTNAYEYLLRPHFTWVEVAP